MADNEDGKRDVEMLKGIYSYEQGDSAVVYNIISQLAIVGGLLVLFFILRPILLWLYSPNTKDCESHPAHGFYGRFNWIIPLYKVPDTTLLPLIGLDSFMMLQTMKMMYRLLFCLSLIVTPILGWSYYNEPGEKGSEQLFTKLSINNTDENSNVFYLVIVLEYVVTFIIFYFIYIYYKKYVGLRQLYIRDPSMLTSIPNIKRLQFENGSIERALSFINIQRSTLFFTGIPSELETNGDFMKYLEAIGITGVTDTILVKDVKSLNVMIFKREMLIRNFEKTINKVYKKMNQFSVDNIEECKENIECFNKSNLKESAINEITPNFDQKDRNTAFLKFIDGFEKFKIKKDGVDMLKFYLERLKYINEKILAEKHDLKGTPLIKSDIIEIIEMQNRVENAPDFNSSNDFVMYKDFFDFTRHHETNISHLSVNRKCGFATFDSQKEASCLSQSIISSRIFSIDAMKAPAPRDIIWTNLNKSPIKIYFWKVFGIILIFLFTIFFILLITMISKCANIDILEEYFDSKLPKSYSWIKEPINGIVAPFIYSQSLSFSIIILRVVLSGYGIVSNSEFELKLLQSYYSFTLYNGFLAMILSQSVVDLLEKIFYNKMELNELITYFIMSLGETSLFFFNTVIQKALLGNIFLLVKPVNLISQSFARLFQRNRTRREKIESVFPENISFAASYPMLVLVFPMCITYSLLNPMILLPGAVHFLLAYFTLKNEFMYVCTNEFESGGSHWSSSCDQIIYSLYIMHITMLCRLLYLRQRGKVMFVIALIGFTYYFKTIINKLFSTKVNFHPVNTSEEVGLDKFIRDFRKERYKMLDEWSDLIENVDEDSVELSKLHVKNQIMAQDSYPYKHPEMMEIYSKLLMPVGFFRSIRFIEKYDKNGVFGMYPTDSK